MGWSRASVFDCPYQCYCTLPGARALVSPPCRLPPCRCPLSRPPEHDLMNMFVTVICCVGILYMARKALMAQHARSCQYSLRNVDCNTTEILTAVWFCAMDSVTYF